MKRIIILPLFLLFFGCVSNDRVTELENRIDSLEVHVGELETKIANYEKTVKKPTKTTTKKKSAKINQDLGTQIAPMPLTTTKKNEVVTTSGRCQAITKAGTQCSRNAQEGSSYCWQHQGSGSSLTKEKSSSYSSDRTIYTGPRGGQYYINSKGNKVYVKKKK